MKWNKKRLVCMPLMCLIALWCVPTPAQVNLDDLVRRSTFVFQGTVAELEAATMPIVPISEQTVIVKVENILQAPNALAGYAGKQITVYVNEPVKVGERLVFFTTGWLEGESIAVKEVSRLPVTSLENLRGQVAEMNQRLADRLLGERIAGAKLVVAGRVAAVKPRPDLSKVLTEHDPQWQEAIIEVDTVLKGAGSVRRTSIFFPSSLDVLWVGVPRFKPGQEGVWILHTDEANVKGYTALDQLDFQSKDQVDRIKDLVKRF